MHVNPNMIRPVLDGIAEGEAHGTPERVAAALAELPALTERLRPNQAGMVIGAFVPARRLAYLQGFIAASSA